MATLTELRGLFGNSDLQEKVEAALIIEADILINSAPTAADKTWVDKVLANPASEATKALNAVLAANSGAAVGAITGASDATLQTAVNTVVPVLVDALAGV